MLRLKRVRNPDVVSLEHFEHFLKQARAGGIVVWLAGLQPDLIEAFRRLNFSAWLPDDHIFPQGGDEDSATLAGIRRIQTELSVGQITPPDKLYYLV